jgi:hypothetical protein
MFLKVQKIGWLACFGLACLLFPGMAARAAVRQLPCNWAILSPADGEASHPGWPRHIAPSAQSCSATTAGVHLVNPGALQSFVLNAPVGKDAVFNQAVVQSAQDVLMVSVSPRCHTVLRVIALESGAAGQVIRCRSSFDGVILLGRVVDARTLAMVEPGTSRPW